MSPTGPPAIVLGLSPTGLHVVRELGRAGVRVTGVSDAFQAGRLSRFLESCIIERDPAVRLERLCALFPAVSDGGARPILIATSDQDVDWVIGNAARLERHFTFSGAYRNDLAARIMTKESFYELCQRHGVAFPLSWKGRCDEIAAYRNAISYPCMIKPSRIHDVKSQMAGRKGWIARHAGEFDDILPRIPSGAGILLVQEIVPGPESAISLYCGYFDGGGNVHQPFTARKLRQYPPGFGSASLVQSAAEDESRNIAERFLRALAYEGIAAAEFKKDPATGQLKMIEINVRPSLWFSVSAAAGKQPVLAQYRALAALPQPGESPQEDGVRWRYSLKDGWSAAFYRANPDFVLPPPDLAAVGNPIKHVSAVFAADDPAPMFGDMAAMALKLAGRAGGALRGR